MILTGLKQSLAFAVGIGNSLTMLYLFIKILIFKEVIVAEPYVPILLIEIFVTSIGIFYLYILFKNNHQILRI